MAARVDERSGGEKTARVLVGASSRSRAARAPQGSAAAPATATRRSRRRAHAFEGAARDAVRLLQEGSDDAVHRLLRRARALAPPVERAERCLDRRARGQSPAERAG